MQVQVEEIPLKKMTSIDAHHLKVITVDSGNPGPHVHIQASVHGAELQGNAVIFELLRFLKSGMNFHGSFTLVPIANPMGINHKEGGYTAGRYNAISGNNWNRNYHNFVKLSSEYKQEDCDVLNLGDFCEGKADLDWHQLKSEYRKALSEVIEARLGRAFEYGISDDSILALNLQKLAVNADVVLDLHTGGVCAKYLYTPEFSLASSKNLNFPYTLVIPEDFAGAMDEACFAPWVKLRDEMRDKGREINLDMEAYTLELGDQEQISLEEARRDLAGILNYLKTRGMFDENIPEDWNGRGDQKQYACQLRDFRSYYAKTGGLAQYRIRPGDFLKKGDLMVTILDFRSLDQDLNLEECIHEMRCIEDAIYISGPISSAISEGMELITVMENYFEL